MDINNQYNIYLNSSIYLQNIYKCNRIFAMLSGIAYVLCVTCAISIFSVSVPVHVHPNFYNSNVCEGVSIYLPCFEIVMPVFLTESMICEYHIYQHNYLE